MEAEEGENNNTACLVPERDEAKPTIVSIVKDATCPDECPDRARKTLPKGLKISRSGLPNAGLGVWAETAYEEGTRFGPYNGVLVDKTEGHNSGYAWEIRRDGGRGDFLHCIDGRDETRANWMRFVNCARNDSEQNLRAIQEGEGIFYVTGRPIEQDAELLVFYGEEFWRMLGARTTGGKKASPGRTSLCSICGTMLTSAELLQRHLQSTHGKPKDAAPEAYNLHADVSAYVKAVALGRELLAQAMDQPSTSTGHSSAWNRSRSLSASSQKQRGASKSVASSSSQPHLDECALSGEEEEGAKRTWQLHEKGDSDDDLDISTVPDPVVCTFYEDVQDWAEGLIGLGGNAGADEDDSEDSQDKLLGTRDNEVTADQHLCYECGQLFDKEEKLETHTAEQHAGRDQITKESPSCRSNIDNGVKIVNGKVGNGVRLSKYVTCEEGVGPNHNGSAEGDCVLPGDWGINSGILEPDCDMLQKEDGATAAEVQPDILSDDGDGAPHEVEEAIEVNDGQHSCPGDDEVGRGRTDGVPGTFGAKDASLALGYDEAVRTIHSDDDSEVDMVSDKEQEAVEVETAMDEGGGEVFTIIDQDEEEVGDASTTDREISEMKRPPIKLVVQKSGSRKIEDGMSQQEWRQLICSICRKACHTKQALEEHQKTHTLFKCPTCFVSFLNEESLAQHELEHTERPFYCGTCGKTYKSHYSLKEHEYSHSSQKPFVCPYCPRGFLRHKKMKLHVKKVHQKLLRAAQRPPPSPLVLAVNKAPPLPPVETVDMSQMRAQFLEEYESRGAEKTEEVEFQDDAGDNKEMQCNICSQVCFSRKSYRKHIRVHQIWGTAPEAMSSSSAASSPRGSEAAEAPLDAGTSSASGTAGPRPFKCQLCESTFLEEAHLQVHVEIHSMDGPWVCTICKRRLKQRAHLLEHTYVHWGYKPYVCLFCPMEFKRTNEAEKHMLSHKRQDRAKGSTVGVVDVTTDPGGSGEPSDSTAPILQNLLTKTGSNGEALNKSGERSEAIHEEEGSGTLLLDQPLSATQSFTPQRCPPDGKNRPFSCEFCDRSFTAKSSLREHLYLHYGKPYPCDFCERQFTRKAYLIAHMKEIHPQADTSVIEDSVMDTKYEEIISRALERICPIESKATSTLDHGKGKITSPDKLPYTCKVCGKGFNFSTTLQKHMQAHVRLKPLLCDFCERRFVRQSYLDEHIRSQHPPGSRSKDPNKPFKCEVCELTFSKRSYLKDHRYRHKLKKPFPCTLCTKSFRRRCLLQMHISRHHANEYQKMTASQKAASTAAQGASPNTLKIKLPFLKNKLKSAHSSLKRDPLMCHECGTTFSCRANVRRHMRIHSGERPFQCRFCFAAFNRKEVLQGHIKKKHAGGKVAVGRTISGCAPGRYHCEKCDRVFKNSYSLGVHMKQHSHNATSRPFKCQYCDLSFIRVSDRTKHYKFLHGISQPDEVPSPATKVIKTEAVDPPVRSSGVQLPPELHVCHRCGSRFDSFWGLESHSRVHEKHSRFPRPHRCAECGAAFKGLSNHSRHMRVHTVEYIAETKRLLNLMPGRKSRLQSATASNVAAAPTPKAAHTPFITAKEERRHVCPKCGTGYKYARNLRKHIPRHIKSSDRPFQCKICGIYAKTQNSISKHMGIHSVKSSLSQPVRNMSNKSPSASGHPMLSCRHCDAEFRFKSSLTLHERSHAKLNFSFNTRTSETSESSEKRVYVVRGLECPVCHKTFTRRSGVSNHRRVHPDVEFVWKEEIMDHVDTSAEKPFQCQICFQRFRRKSSLSNHLYIHRFKGKQVKKEPIASPTMASTWNAVADESGESPVGEERPFSCDKCSCTFKTKGSLTTHSKVHAPGANRRPHVCNICHCTFTHTTNLKKHQRLHTREGLSPSGSQGDPSLAYSAIENAESIDIKTKRPFRCRVCGDTFRAKHLLDEHIQVHSISPRQLQFASKAKEATPEQPSFATSISPSSGAMLVRMTERPYPCPICGDRFKLKSTKYKHIRLHRQSEGKPFRCGDCGLGFFSVGNMTKHMKRVHSKVRNGSSQPVPHSYKALPMSTLPKPSSCPPAITKERPFACKYCGETFTMRCNMNRHRKRHETGNNLPFRCPHCGFGFKSTKERTKHVMRVHTNAPATVEQPEAQVPTTPVGKYKECPLCGDTFSDSSGLYKHMRIHAKSANKPYKCDVCHIGYNTPNGLSRHCGRVKHWPKSSAPGGSAPSEMEDIKPVINIPKENAKYSCRYCPAVYKDRSSVWRHEQVHKAGPSLTRPFPCKICGFGCYSKLHLNRHMQMHRKTPGLLHSDRQGILKRTADRCKRCGLSFKTKSLYLVHIKRCSTTSTFVCQICSVTFSNQIMLTKHVRQSHGGLQRDIISIAGRDIVRETGHDKKFCCDQCDLRYKRPSELEKHLRRHALGFIKPQEGFSPHPLSQENAGTEETGNVSGEVVGNPYIEQPQSSQERPAESPSIKSIKESLSPGRTPLHNRTVKSNRARPFVCQTCGFAFMTAIHLRKHTYLHKVAHTKQFVCKICTLGYTRLLDYHRHCNVVHPWRKGLPNEIECPRCKQKYDTKAELVEHLEKQTCEFIDDPPDAEPRGVNAQGEGEADLPLPSALDQPGTSNGQDATQCPICNRTFSARGHVEVHMKVHDNWEHQPFQCERCKVGYSTKQHLSKHVNMDRLCIKWFKDKERKQIFDKKLGIESSEEGDGTTDGQSQEMPSTPLKLLGPASSSSRKPHTCHHCNKSFAKRKQWLFHLELHKPSPDRPFVCSKCGIGYKTYPNYAKHMKWEHTKPKVAQKKLTAAIFMCRDCGYSVTNKALLLEHTQFGCPNKKSNPAIEAPKACPVCGSYFSSASMLCIHLHEHVYPKLLVCSQCPLRFSQPEEREKHERDHPNWNNMLLKLLSSEFNRKLNPEREDQPTVQIKTEPGLLEAGDSSNVGPSVSVSPLVETQEETSQSPRIKLEPAEEPAYDYSIGSLAESLLGDYQALLPDDSEESLQSILQQGRRQAEKSSASRLEKIVSSLAQKPTRDSHQTATISAAPSETSHSAAASVPGDWERQCDVSLSAESSETPRAAVRGDFLPAADTITKQVREVMPGRSPNMNPVKESPSAISNPQQPQPKASKKPKLFRCRYCPSAFRLKGLCVSHERTVHRKIYSRTSQKSKKPLKDLSKMSICEICNAVFEQQSSLSRHMLFKHGVTFKPKEPEPEVPPTIIEEAPQRSISPLEVADKSPVAGPYITNITSLGTSQESPSRSSQPSILKQRLQAPSTFDSFRLRDKFPPYIPSTNTQQVSKLESLLTGSATDYGQASLEAADALEFRPYKCHRCSFAFTQRHHLVRHIKRDSCAFHVLGRKAAAQLKNGDGGGTGSTNSSQNVGAGVKIKVATKNHKCPICSKAFWKRVRLVNHMKMHDGADLFQCQYCFKEYVFEAECLQHEKLCHSQPRPLDDAHFDEEMEEQDEDLDFDQGLDLEDDVDLGPDEELDLAQEQAFREEPDQNMDLAFADEVNEGGGGDSLGKVVKVMGVAIKQEPPD